MDRKTVASEPRGRLFPRRDNPHGVIFDTLEYARRLRQAGFSEQQAEGSAQALAAAMTETLATKQDLRELERHVDSRFFQLEARFDARLADLERRLTFRLGGMVVAAIGAASAFVRIL